MTDESNARSRRFHWCLLAAGVIVVAVLAAKSSRDSKRPWNQPPLLADRIAELGRMAIKEKMTLTREVSDFGQEFATVRIVAEPYSLLPFALLRNGDVYCMRENKTTLQEGEWLIAIGDGANSRYELLSPRLGMWFSGGGLAGGPILRRILAKPDGAMFTAVLDSTE